MSTLSSKPLSHQEFLRELAVLRSPISNNHDIRLHLAADHIDRLENRAADEPAVRPVAWWRRVTSYVPGEPIEYDEEFSGGDDQPDGDGWYPLYSRPAEPPKANPDMERLIDNACICRDGLCRECNELVAAIRSIQPPSVADDLVFCPDLYEMLLNVQNGIDSPASAGTANRIIRRIDKLRNTLTKSAGPDELNGESNPRAGVSVGQPFGPAAECMPGYWQCPNCKACNHLVIHHTSCPQCRTLRLASGESVE